MLGQRLAALNVALPRVGEACDDALGRGKKEIANPAEMRRDPPQREQRYDADDADHRARAFARKPITFDGTRRYLSGRGFAGNMLVVRDRRRKTAHPILRRRSAAIPLRSGPIE